MSTNNKIVTRQLINKDIIFQDSIDNDVRYTYDDMCSMINRIKHHLLKNGVEKGDTIVIIHHSINLFHTCCVFACSELGLKFLMSDYPASIESLPYNKMALYSPIKFTISSRTINNPLVLELVKRYGNQVLYEEEMTETDDSDIQPWEVYPEDPLLVTSSSGTTNWSKKVVFSQEEVYTHGHENINLCCYEDTDTTVQVKNLHHGASMMITFLPSLIKTKRHIGAGMPEYKSLFLKNPEYYERLVRYLEDENFNRIMIINEDILDEFLKTAERTIGKFTNTLKITTFTLIVSPKLIDYCKKYNLEFYSIFGSLDAKIIPLACNNINKDSEFIPMYLGKIHPYYRVHEYLGDSLYTFKDRDNDDVRIIHDRLEMLDDGGIILKGRLLDENKEIREKTAPFVKGDFAVVQNGDDRYLALFDVNEDITNDMRKIGYKNILHINKEAFYIESHKLNYDALRGHFIYYDKHEYQW